jgi:hypothetical protein
VPCATLDNKDYQAIHKQLWRNLQGVNSMNKQSTKEKMQTKVDRNKLTMKENEITFSKWEESCH